MQSCRNLLMTSDYPLLSENLVTHWKQVTWSRQKWSSVLMKESYPFRTTARKCSKMPVRETECDTIYMTIEEFFAYTDDHLATSQKWFYFDYKNLREWTEDSEAFSDLHWGDVGFPEKNSSETYIWIGSIGAHTLCHYDTYGFNIIAQLHGRKRWILFPPTEMNSLCPTRVPFEESTVGSKINFACKYGVKGRKLKNCYTVDLNPGDVLFVPPKWWHFVTNLTTSVSVNIWLPINSDHESRLEEALVRNYVFSVTRSLSIDDKKKLINPNELLEDESTDTSIINYCICKSKACRNQPRSVNERFNDPTACTNESDHRQPSAAKFKRLHQFCGQVEDLISCSCNGHLIEDAQPDSHLTLLENIINSFCNPDIICSVKEKLLESVD